MHNRALMAMAALALAGTAGPAAAGDFLSAKGSSRARHEEPRVTGCESIGPGYMKVPGTDTCVKVGGQVRVESNTTWSGHGSDR